MKSSRRWRDPKSITRYLAAIGVPTDVPARSPSRGPPRAADDGLGKDPARRAARPGRGRTLRPRAL